MQTKRPISFRSTHHVRADLIAKREIAFLDIREEDEHAQAHPLFAANFPLSRIERDAWTLLPRCNVPIVLLDAGGGEAEKAAHLLLELGYTDVSLLDRGLDGWVRSGGEVFRDVNVPSKAFGELVEARRHTPSLSAEDIHELVQKKENMVIVDARRFDEYHTMNIPSSISVPGGELALRIRDLAPAPETLVVVNCAGRTRSLIGTQSLINSGIPNRVVALRNGTIGWVLAGFSLENGQTRQFGTVSEHHLHEVRKNARSLADRAGVKRVRLPESEAWRHITDRSHYFLDVRTPEEYQAGHLPGYRSAPGGQLIQETEMVVPVRGARIVLSDTDGVRANMAASWLAQMGWDVYALDDVPAEELTESGFWKPEHPPLPATNRITPEILAQWLEEKKSLLVIDVAASTEYRRGHIPGACFLIRSRIASDWPYTRHVDRVVVTSSDGVLAGFTAKDIERQIDVPVYVLKGGTQAWHQAGLQLETGTGHLLSPAIDRYRRPYEGTENPREAMEAYLNWEYGLVGQLERDATHGFRVI